MSCRNCGRPLEPDARFCPACGTATVGACRSCGSSLSADARFCPACGAPTDASEQGARPEGAAGRERKVATIVFADIVGFTRLTEAHDPELVQGIVTRAFDRLSEEVARYEGAVEKFAGDAMLALFGVPQTHEDDAERGVRAALEMQSALSELAAELRAKGRPDIQLRIGIETGEVLVDLGRASAERDRIVTGDPVNTAARLQSAADAGSIVVGPGAYAATRGVVEYEELPPLELKGKSLPVAAWRAVRVKARRGGLRSPLGLEAPLIGRDEELNLLKETIRRVVVEGRPHLVTVLGAAGVGKSRLTWELEKYLDGLPESYHWRKGRSFSYGQQSYGGLVDMLKADAGIRDDDTEDEASRKVVARLEVLGVATDAGVSGATGALFGGTSAGATAASGARDELFEGWRRYLEAIARRGPLILVQEDIHWADEGFLDFLDFLARWSDAPILLLCLARHELLERRSKWGGGIANSATIVLEPLAPTESAALLDALIPGSLPSGFKDRIVAVAEGNPLFSEELVRMLIDRGVARRGPNGWELAAPVEELEIPGSIHALLAARLDSLPGAEKRVTQAAAVVGRIFWDAVLAHVIAGASPELDRLLRGLRVKELVVMREPSSLSDAHEYGFRHVLIRDVAYESVPKSERAEKHLAVARWAEERLAGREDELVELLASHYASALAYREEQVVVDDDDLAGLRRTVLEHARRAGRRALELWDATSAASWFRVALRQATRLELRPIEHGRISLEYLNVAVTTERPDDVLVVARDAAERLEAIARPGPTALDVLAQVQAHMGFLMYEMGRVTESRELLEDGLARLAGGPPTAARAGLLWRLGWLNWRAVSAAEAVPILERAAAEARVVGAADIERRAVHDLGIAVAYSGRPEEGVRLLERSLEMAREASDQGLLLRCYINVPALKSGVTWDVVQAHALAREGLERARRGGHRFYATYLAANLGEGALDEGRIDEATALLAEARALAHELADENLISLAYGYTGELYARTGRLDEAGAAWAEAERHGADEPQGAGRTAVAHGLVLWREDPNAAVEQVARDLTGHQGQDVIASRVLAAMAARTGQVERALAAVATMSLSTGTSRLEADAAWRDALLEPPSAAAVDVIVVIGERYQEAGLPVVAADAFADASLVARRAGLATADALTRRADEIYAATGTANAFEPAPSKIDVAAARPAAGG